MDGQYSIAEGKSRRFSDAWDEFARETGLAALDVDPDVVFAGVRDRVIGSF